MTDADCGVHSTGNADAMHLVLLNNQAALHPNVASETLHASLNTGHFSSRCEEYLAHRAAVISIIPRNVPGIILFQFNYCAASS